MTAVAFCLFCKQSYTADTVDGHVCVPPERRRRLQIVPLPEPEPTPEDAA